MKSSEQMRLKTILYRVKSQVMKYTPFLNQSEEESKIEIINKKIEDCIDYITSKYSNNSDLRLVGIVDPPRAGVHRNVAKKLRTFKVFVIRV